MWSFLLGLFRKNTKNKTKIVEDEYRRKTRTELLAMDKKQLEAHGRAFGVELDRRRSKETLVRQVLEAQITSSNG